MAPGARNNRETGRKAEDLACSHLLSRGYRILSRNWRCRYGEIDIIAEQEGVLVFIEVKYRRSTSYGSALEAVDSRKASRLCRLAQMYLVLTGDRTDRPCRIEVVAITETREGLSLDQYTI